ncbi:MAG: beta-1,3-glucanase family protein [Candidatus Aureabacteria bacterium]|nr:beta-1,3-glucanase family protein [Candidatus Auribacterota bacterium]
MKRGMLYLSLFSILALFASGIAYGTELSRAGDLLKVTLVNNSDVYSDDQVYVQMVGTDAAGSGMLGHVDLATSAWVEISEADNTVTPPGGPWGRQYTDYARKLSDLKSEGLHSWSFEMPHIISGRIFVSFEQPVYYHVSPGPALETPSAVDSALPNYPLIFDKVELDWENGKEPFLNTTTVDFFSISFMLDLKLSDGTSQSRGFTSSRKAILDALQGLPSIWQNGVVSGSSGIIRFIAPQNLLDPNPFEDFFDSYVNECWTYYTTHTLTLQSPPNTTPWSATGQVVEGVFTFNVAGSPEVVTINNLAGQGEHIFGCDGAGYLFTTGTDSIAKQGIITQMGAALNRSVLFNVTDSATWWNDPSQFYGQDATNQYSKVLHQAAYQGYCYGFPYDDVGNFSTGVTGDATEAVISIQPMSDQAILRLKPNKGIFSTTDNLSLLVDVTQAISTPFYPVFYITLPSGQKLYILEGNRFTGTPSAYVQRKRKNKFVPVAVTVPGAESNIPLLGVSFKNIPPGDYVIQGGAVNTQTPLVNGIPNWLSDCSDSEIIRVR